MRRVLCVIALLVAGCAQERRELGVDVFSSDTVPARFTVDLSGGNLQVGLRMARAFSRPDRTLLLETPGSMLVQGGDGTAVITTVDTLQRIVVQPLGISPDSAEKVAVVGRVVTIRRVGEEKRLTITAERP